MEREIIKIDEELCNGCGLCIPNCHEGALQIIDGKARLISDLMCDGLGACLGHCPVGAMTIENREAEAYDEVLVMKDMVSKGRNTVVAHLKHLKEHNEIGFLNQALDFLKENSDSLDFEIKDVLTKMMENKDKPCGGGAHHHEGGGCPGSAARTIQREERPSFTPQTIQSELGQWPIQMHLINPLSSQFDDTDFLLAADCTAFTLGSFHPKYLKNKTLGIACPKLDNGMEVYLGKLIQLIDGAEINTLTVVIMEVPCCGGLIQLAKAAADQADRKIPIKKIVVGIKGDILEENWI